MKKKFKLTDLDCANCAAKMEKRINELPGVAEATITYGSQRCKCQLYDAENDDRCG